jgi:ABC-type lipoprotein export system ATPase subunit/ABC-type antimicrobial peptide transport system permease subunit
MIELRHIKKEYKRKKHRVQALQEVNLRLPNKGMICILGASGSGKSTLLNIIGGLDSYDSGEMIVDGKNTKTFHETEYEKYRNSYVSFIFQEFHLIEEYTVYENIALVEQLQSGRESKKYIQEILNKLGLEGYENRKIYELSGGEKQRVGIARALVKKPKMILADEPTGSLDSKTGSDVMSLLKEISREILVVFVTHNREYALKYADRIIEVEDGKIIKEEGVDFLEESGKYQSKKAKLPFKYAFKLGRKLLFHHKIRLGISILLMTISSMFLIYVYFGLTYDIDEQHFKILKNKKIDTIEIDKSKHSKEITNRYPFPLKHEDKEYIQSKLNSASYPLYEIDEDVDVASFFNINVYIQKDIFNDLEEEPTDLYTNNHMHLDFVELESIKNTLPIKEPIIGRYPTQDSEIMISNYVADLMIKYGIYEYQSDTIYYPKSYEELVNSSKIFQFGSYNSCKIVGIIHYDLRIYDELKKYRLGDAVHIPSPKVKAIENELRNKQEQSYSKVYMSHEFVKNLKYPVDRKLDTLHHVIRLKMDNQNLVGIDYIHEMVTYYDGVEWKKTNSLKENEVLLNINNFTENYEESLKSYLPKHSNRSQEEVRKEFFLQQLPQKNLIGKELNLEIYENTTEFYDLVKEKEQADKVYTNLKVIGLIDTTNNYRNLVAKNVLKEYQEDYFRLSRILVYEEDDEKLKEIFTTFPYDGEYVINSIYSTEGIYRNLLSFRNMFLLLFIVFLSLSILLISNFMMNSVLDYKKNIGILRAFGTTKKDIFKIFFTQMIGLVFLLFVFSFIGMKLIIYYLNGIYDVSETVLFYFNIRIVLLFIIYLLVITITASLLPILRMLKIKPVEAIRNE